MSPRPDDDRSAVPSTGGLASQPLSAGTYLAVSAAGLVVSLGLLLFLVFGAERILAAGLDHRVFYVLLVPLGLSAAAFAFGAMNSTGTFTQGGSRQVGLTGPAMFAALVVAGGFFLVPQGGLMSLAIRVDRSAEAGGGPVPGALVTVDWGIQRIDQVTDGSGQASFLGLPPGASTIEVEAKAEGYVPERRVLASVPAGGVVRFELAPATTRMRGTVFSRETGAPLAGVALNFGSGAATATTDAAGNFAVDLPAARGTQIVVIGTRGDVRGLNTEVVVTDSVPVHLNFAGR